MPRRVGASMVQKGKGNACGSHNSLPYEGRVNCCYNGWVPRLPATGFCSGYDWRE